MNKPFVEAVKASLMRLIHYPPNALQPGGAKDKRGEPLRFAALVLPASSR